MINGYWSIREAAEMWNITPRRVRALCKEERIEGASKLGREWAIPSDTNKPVDRRITTGEYRNWRNRESGKKD